MDYRKIPQLLTSESEEGYRKFCARLTPTGQPILGVRMPILRRMAEELSRGDWELYLHAAHENYEETMLAGLALAAAVSRRGFPVSTAVERIRDFLPEIDNWAVCDSFCASLKLTKRHPEEIWKLVCACAEDDAAFFRRFAAAMVNFHFAAEPYTVRSLELLGRICTEEYYVSMGVAWAAATCACKAWERTLMWLTEDCPLDGTTWDRTLRKILESRIPTPEQKVEIRELRVRLRPV